MLALSLLAGVGASLLALPASVHASTGPTAWHLPLVGLVPPPSPASNPAAPYHRFQPTGEGTNVLVLSTEQKVLAGVQPQNGELIWRRQYADAEKAVTHIAAGQETILVWTKPSASDLHAVSAATGKLLWQQERGMWDMCGADAARVVVNGMKAGTVSLQCGGMAQEIDLSTGQPISGGGSDLDMRVAASNTYTNTFYFESSGNGFTVYSSNNAGGKGSDKTVSNGPSSSADAVLLGRESKTDSLTSALVWANKGDIFGTLAVDGHITDLVLRHLPLKVAKVIDVGLASRGVFVAVNEDESAAVIISLNKDNVLQNCGKFPLTSLTSYMDPLGGVHLASLDFSRVLGLASLQIWSQTPDNALGMVSAHSFPLKRSEYTGMRGFALQVLPIRSTQNSHAPAFSRIALYTSSGALQLWEGDNLKWTREEGLATADVGPLAIYHGHHATYESASTLFASSATRSIYAVRTNNDTTLQVERSLTMPSNPECDFKWVSIESATVQDGGGRVEATAKESCVSGVSLKRFIIDADDLYFVDGPIEVAAMAETPTPDTVGVTIAESTGHLEGRIASGESSSPSWVFALPAGESFTKVYAQVPGSSLALAGPTHPPSTLLAVVSSSSTLIVLNAATGQLVFQAPEVDEAALTWDTGLSGWKLVTTRVIGGETKLRLYKIRPRRSSPSVVDATNVEAFAVEVTLPGSFHTLGLSTTTLRLAAPCLLFTDHVGRIAAMPLRLLESLASGRPAVPGLPWILSGTRDLLPSPSARLTLGGPHPQSLPLRESESLVWSSSPLDLFVSLFTPSRSFDKLTEEFNRVQLGVVVAVLVAALVGTQRWAAGTRMKGMWLD